MKLFNFCFLTLLVGGTLATNSQAAQSWSSQPTWASPSRATAYAKESARGHEDIAPFSPGSNNLALDVGQVFLMGDLSSKFADSIGSQLHYTYGVSDMFGFDASFGYSSHSDGKTDGKYSLTTLLAGMRTNLSWYDKVIPHINFGLGFYKPSFQQTTTSVSPLVFGVHLGPGIDLEVTRQLFFGAGLTFHDIFGTTKATAEGPVDAGGTYTSFLLRAGVTF